jgi:hypothetical protein
MSTITTLEALVERLEKLTRALADETEDFEPAAGFDEGFYSGKAEVAEQISLILADVQRPESV